MNRTNLRFAVLVPFLIFLFSSGISRAQSSNQGNSQESITKALKDVTKIYGTKFVYEKSLMEGRTTSYDFKKIKGDKVEDVLKSILYPNRLVFLYIKENYYTIVSQDRLEQQQIFQAINNNSDINTHGKQTTNSYADYLQSVSELTTNSINNVGHIVKGQVRNIDGIPMEGVSIVVEGGENGTSTNKLGEYLLKDVDDNAFLVFSFVGYSTERIPVAGKRAIDVVLQESNVGLNAVVVVGFATQKKINLTGAVDVINADKLKNRSDPNMSQLVQGLSPNLNLSMSNRGGEPGSSYSWSLRGLGSINESSAPLILVDGVETPIDDIDPETVESISILKDASASAIYGSRAPFGVVLITTKRGDKSKGIRIQYTNNLAWANPIRIPEFNDNITWATAVNEGYTNSGLAPFYSDAQVQRMKEYNAGTYTPEYDTVKLPASLFNGRSVGNANYNYPSIFFKKNSFSQKHNISMSGGNDQTQYYVSSGYYNQGGLLTWGNDSYERYNVLANITTKANNWLSFDFGTKYSQTQTDYAIGPYGTSDRAYIFSSIFGFGPMTPLHLVDGSIYNPAANALIGDGRDITTTNDMWLKLGTTIEPIKGWKTNLTYNYNLGSISESQYPKPVPVNIPNGAIANAGQPDTADIESRSMYHYYIFDATSSYEKTIGPHYFKILAGYEQSYNYENNLNGSRNGITSELVPSINAATGRITLGASADHVADQAVFGRINYNFKEKYLVEFSGRYNGSSRFASDSRWGFFPSVSAGYNVSKENFWKSIKSLVNNFKVRGSYGSLGNENVGYYPYLSTIPFTSNANYLINGLRPTYASAPGIVSATLTWETVTTGDVGLDASFLKDRLGLTFDWFDRTTTNMFGPATALPAVLGTTVPYENNASLATKGFEISLDWKDIISRNISYNVRLTLGNNETTVLKYFNPNGLIDDAFYRGEKIGSVWGYQSDGLIQNAGEKMADQTYLYPKWGPGDMKYKDLNGDGVINDGTRTLNDHGDLKIIGNQSPHYNIGFSAGVNWKGLSLDMFWQGVLKQDFIPDYHQWTFWGFSQYGVGQSLSYKNGKMNDYWRPADESNSFGPNTNSYFPKPYETSEQIKNTQFQTKYVLSAAYMRLKNLEIAYNIPGKLLKNRFFIKAAKIYVSGQNLITITKLPGEFDPETVFASVNYGPYQNMFQSGLYGLNYIYPVARRYSCGINITF